MKTTQAQLAAIIFIILMSFMTSCDIIYDLFNRVDHSEKDTENLWYSKENSNRIPDETIIKFHDTVSQETKLERIIKFKSKMNLIDSCGCGDLFLFEHNQDFKNIMVSPEARLASSDEDVEPEGGSAFFNLSIHMDTLFESDNKSATRNNTTIDFDQYIKVAIIDGGIAPLFNLEQNLWVNKDDDGNCYVDDLNGYDFKNNTGANSGPINSHGTFVSKILMSSIPPSVKVALMDLRIFDENGNGSLFDALCAIEYAIKNNADFINLSWGYYRDYYTQSLENKSDSLLLAYILKAQEANIPVFASAGNKKLNTDHAMDYHFPSGFFSIDPYFPDNLVSITAQNATGNSLATHYSNHGDNSVFIATVGRHIIDLGWTSIKIEGTSYATPQALGYAIHLKHSNPLLITSTLKKCILTNADNMGFPLKSKGLIDTSVITCP